MIYRLFVIFIYFNYAHSASLWVYKSKDNYISIPLTSPLGLLNTSFNVTFDSVFYAFGFNSSPSSLPTIAITRAYMELKDNTDVNYVLLNWEKEATSKVAGPIIQYPTTGIKNAKKIGEQLGVVLLELSKHGLDLDKVHLIGHSLGSHLLSATGKKLQKKKKIVGRITGLDPAGPLYNKPTLLKGLNKDDAVFVVAIHTNPQLYGTSNNVGHIDIWPNCDLKLQPGCPHKFLDGCSHGRAPLYYSEAINSPKAFPSVQADSCDNWKTKKGSNDTHPIIYLGENIDRKSRGYFYMRTNTMSPFGKGLDGIEA
ncbi:phospholipase A1-like isoform X1 [Pieris napi]|uniref:phospholipase A1-like isoform X1 n=1 Tax=Pieris napi TaxID=78633 RepID=UPI001FBA3A3A|nr:phospholipase A1-like isoform X1 [Pieris napi]